MKNRKAALICILILLLCSGCRYADPDDAIRQTQEPEAFLQEAVYDVDFEKPSVLPKVLVDRNGYEAEGQKVALFRGQNLSETFRVILEETDQVVYEGNIGKAKYDALHEEYISKGDFSQVTKPGVYYLETSVIGQSYPFEVKENAFESLYENILDTFYYHRCGTDLEGSVYINNHKACHLKETVLKEDTGTAVDTHGGWHTGKGFEKDVADGCKIVSDLLSAYDIIGFKNENSENKSRNETKLLNEVVFEGRWLLSMQDEITKGVYSGVYPEKENNATAPEADERKFFVGEISREATAEFAAVMAQISRVIKEQNLEFSKECILASQNAYAYLEKQNINDDLIYYAAAELYKTTGLNQYQKQIRVYLSLQDPINNSKFERRLYGNIAYMTTEKFPVDVLLCSELMDEFMAKAEELASQAREDSYMTWAGENGYNTREILQNTFLLSLIDYVITSQEYMKIIENQLHYLFGRNENGIEMISGKGVLILTENKEEYELHLQATLFFIIHEIMEREAET